MTHELKDYSGEFNPNHRYADFSKEALVKLMEAWWNIGLRIDVWWHRLVKDRVSLEVARELNAQQWVRIAPEEIAFMRDALNVHGNDVASFWKVLQNDIGFPQGLFDLTYDLKNPNHGIITIHKCGGYDFYLQENGPEFCHWLCHDLETAAFDAYTAAFNPDIKVTCLKLPPKQSDDEPTCQWEFTLEK